MIRVLWILIVLLSHWRRHPLQLGTLLIGLISATALWSGVQALNQQARDSYERAAATFGGARTAMLVSRSGAAFPQKIFVELRRAGWPVSPVVEGRVQIDGRSFRLLGIEPLTLPAEVGNAPAIGKTGLQSFLSPPGASKRRNEPRWVAITAAWVAGQRSTDPDTFGDELVAAYDATFGKRA